MCRAVQPGGAVSDTRRTMARCAAGWVCRQRMCRPGGGRGSPADGGSPALEPTPAARQGPEAQAVVFLEPKWAALCPSVQQELSSQSGNGQASPPLLWPHHPGPSFRSREAITSSLSVTLTWGPWGLVGTRLERAEEPGAHESVSEAPVGRLSCRSAASVRPSVPADAVVVPALQVCPLSLRAPPGSGAPLACLSSRGPFTAAAACPPRPAQGSVGHVQ